MRIEAEAGTVLTAELDPPLNYVLRLYDFRGRLIAEEGGVGSPGLRRIIHTVVDAGRFYVVVDGGGALSNPEDPYHLEVTVDELNTDVRVYLDEGWMGDSRVFKLIPDATGSEWATFVDVVAEVTADGEPDTDPSLTVEIPGDVFGPPELAMIRDCHGCPAVPVDFYSLSPGRYRAVVPLAGRPPMRRQLVLRFIITRHNTTGEVIPTVDVRFGSGGGVVATDDGPPIRLVTNVGAIVITNRDNLYELYDPAQVARLLGSVTHAMQGPPGGGAGSLHGAIYFADDYRTGAGLRDWDNLTWDPSTKDTANVVSRAVDDMIDDWLEDASTGPNVLIIGDDDVVPQFRQRCPCEDVESDTAPHDNPALNRVLENDFILTDNPYGDIDGSWSEGDLERPVGRIVGDTAEDMLTLFEAGLLGPDTGTSRRALLASWDGCDLHYGAGSEGIVDHVRAWGFSASRDLVDNSGWRASDLLADLGDPFSLFIHSDHGNSGHIAAPGSKKKKMAGISASEIAGAIDASSAALLRPFSGFCDCQTGYALVNDGVVDELVHLGFSGVVASGGITYFTPGGSEGYTEEIFNKFWRRTMPDSGSGRTVGDALRKAKVDYTAGLHWSCKDKTAAQELTLFGVPWMRIPKPTSKSMSPPIPARKPEREFGAAKALAGDSYQVESTIEIDTWEIDSDTVPGFELVAVEGLEQWYRDGPVVPMTRIQLQLPLGAEISSVELEREDPAQLGVVDLPYYTAGIKTIVNEVEDRYDPIPASEGTVPDEPVDSELRFDVEHSTLHVEVYPVTHDAATGETTLYRSSTLRVVYEVTESVAVTEFGLSTSGAAPGGSIATTATVSNVTDSSVDLTAILRVFDSGGVEVETASEGPIAVAPGVATTISPSCPAPADEGTYAVRLELEELGEVVAVADQTAVVSIGDIADFFVPTTAVPMRPATFGVRFVNNSGAPVETVFELQILDLSGRVEDELEAVTRTVPGGGQELVEFSWDARVVPLGDYMARVVVTPAGADERSKTRLFSTGPLDHRWGGVRRR
jgi:hypothetical protein